MASELSRRPFLLFVVLYAAVAAVAGIAYQVLPSPLHDAVRELTTHARIEAVDAEIFRGRDAAIVRPPTTAMWAIATAAMSGAGLLALPLAGLYTITRQKRGYRQSVVHTLILLPVIVAGVVVLVKYSLALAFSLAGIVAAVRFRTTLEDSKDAAYVFAATGIGLASGVELTVAAALSVMFNLVTLLLFRSDLGRTPARLEGEMAEERMRRALEMANRTKEFVARLDREILERMAPEQLEALADRAWRRRKAADEEGEGAERLECTVTVRTDGSSLARERAELALARLAKEWRFQRASTDADGVQTLEYFARLKRSTQPTAFLDALRGTEGVRDVQLR
jgi:hypothetical protein